MPSGYTAGVADGTVTDLRTFALTCARGMGALIMMRDEPMTAPIPQRVEPSDYAKKRLDEAIARLAELKAMTPAQIEAAAAEWNKKNDAYRAETVQKNAEVRGRYDRMIAAVEAWEGSPEGLKSLMLEQLTSSRNFDTDADPLKYTRPPRTPQEWWSEECREAGRNVEYYAKQDADERARTEERNAWIAQLHASLPPAGEQP